LDKFLGDKIMYQLIGMGIGAGLGYLSDLQRKKQEKQVIKSQIKALEESMYTSDEKEKVLSNINRSYNTTSMGSANQAALGVNQVLNADTLRGLNASRLLGERASKLSEADINITQYNKQALSQMAGVKEQSPVSDFGVPIQGALMGYQAGEALEKMFEPSTTDTANTKSKGSVFGFNMPKPTAVEMSNQAVPGAFDFDFEFKKKLKQFEKPMAKYNMFGSF